MTHDEIVFSALAYWRNRGAGEVCIRNHARSREKQPGSAAKDARALERLSSQELVFQLGERWFLTPAGYKRARGPAAPAVWEPSDAWLLGAILMGSRPLDLDDVVRAADFINHAVPTPGELHGALNRGVAAKLLRVGRAKFAASALGRDLYAKACAAGGKSPLGCCQALGKILECPHCGPRLRTVRFRSYLDQAPRAHGEP